jgi:RecA/RadA recombinase
VVVLEVVYHWAAASAVWPLMVVDSAVHHLLEVDSAADSVVYHLLVVDSVADSVVHNLLEVDLAVDSQV